MKAPFRLPVFVSDRKFLVAANHELIMEMHAANEKETVFITTAINQHDELLDLISDLNNVTFCDDCDIPTNLRLRMHSALGI